MSEVVCDVTVSMDGFVAGPAQSLENPLGIGGEQLHRWQFEAERENAAERALILDAGAFIMGRNMFGPVRGEWSGDWRGWWGEEPPYHAPVFVLTHHDRAPLQLQGTTFHFSTRGISDTLQAAAQLADGKNVAIAGGASTINQFLAAGLIDELRLHTAPLVLGSGERLFAGLPETHFIPVGSRTTDLVTHVVYRRGPSGGPTAG